MKIEIKEGQVVNLKKEYPCIETTMEIKTHEGEFRVWLDEDTIRGRDRIVENSLYHVDKIVRNKSISIVDRLKEITKLPRVNAVQHRRYMSDGTKMGVVIYTVNFENNDIKG